MRGACGDVHTRAWTRSQKWPRKVVGHLEFSGENIDAHRRTVTMHRRGRKSALMHGDGPELVAGDFREHGGFFGEMTWAYGERG